MKKLNLKQPKYIFPLIIFLPITFVLYEVTSVFGGEKKSSVVATDSLNMSIPNADSTEMKNKMASMDGNLEGDPYSAVDGFEREGEDKDTVNSGYSESELDAIDRENAQRRQEEKDRQELEQRLSEQSRHINSYSNYGGGGSGRGSRSASRSEELDDYAKQLEYIQNRSRAAQRAIEKNTGSYDSYDDDDDGNSYGSGSRGGHGSRGTGYSSGSKKKEPEPEIVKKVEKKNADKFNTVSSKTNVDAPLIKAMIDKTTKAHEGTRLRFKLLDDVIIKGTVIKKGTYLYGLVTGFGQQRVRATITNILVHNKFIRVNLSVYDNDGMEGFYVPESAFRDMMKEAGSQAVQQNLNFDSGYSSSLSGESVALQALQNLYSSASNAVSANIRKNKARIKYNTIVYLVNTDSKN